MTVHVPLYDLMLMVVHLGHLLLRRLLLLMLMLHENLRLHDLLHLLRLLNGGLCELLRHHHGLHISATGHLGHHG